MGTTRVRSTRALGLATFLITILVASLVGAAPASAKKESFRPIKKTPRALIFDVNRIDSGAVRKAWARLKKRKRHNRSRRLKLRKVTRKVRRAAKHDTRLRLRKGRRVKRGKLQVVVEPEPTPEPSPAGCSLDPATMTAVDCSTIFSDTGDKSDAASLWGLIDCQTSSRHKQISGGDTHPMANGAGQPSGQARQLTVLDGDDVWGERCEIGENWARSTPMPLYREGQRRITFLSYRLPSSFPLSTSRWQSVMQMKQTQPSANGGGTPIFSLKANKGHWSLWQSDSAGPSSNSHQMWATPAAANTWTRFAFDVTYSQDPGVGKITVYVDLNGDGDALDNGEQSPTFKTYTLKYETTGGRDDDGIAPGESIPSHLRSGIYHDPAIDCPSGGCSSQVDNVQIVG